jgi:hypothetical protein
MLESFAEHLRIRRYASGSSSNWWYDLLQDSKVSIGLVGVLPASLIVHRARRPEEDPLGSILLSSDCRWWSIPRAGFPCPSKSVHSV